MANPEDAEHGIPLDVDRIFSPTHRVVLLQELAVGSLAFGRLPIVEDALQTLYYRLMLEDSTNFQVEQYPKSQQSANPFSPSLYFSYPPENSPDPIKKTGIKIGIFNDGTIGSVRLTQEEPGNEVTLRTQFTFFGIHHPAWIANRYPQLDTLSRPPFGLHFYHAHLQQDNTPTVALHCEIGATQERTQSRLIRAEYNPQSTMPKLSFRPLNNTDFPSLRETLSRDFLTTIFPPLNRRP